MTLEVTGMTVTATPHHQGKFLIVRRSLEDITLPGYWAFPGGRVHYHEVQRHLPDGSVETKAVSETLTQAAAREVLEETGLVTSRAFYVDSYPLGKRAAAHFCVEVVDDNVEIDEAELSDCHWIRDVADMQKLTPRIPGLDNHLSVIQLRMTEGDDPFRPLSELDLVPERYLNRGN